MKFYTTYEITSYGAIFNFIITERNVGKTTAFKARQLLKFRATGKKTVWVRRYKNEKKATANKFYNKKICKIAGVPFSRVKCDGNKCYYLNDAGKWKDFLEIVTVSEATSHRSADDPATADIIFDEFAVTSARSRYYRGNEVEDFIDLFISKKRVNDVHVYFLGNKEAFYNPYFKYFNIPKFEDNFEGIRTFRNGSIAVQILRGVPDQINDVYDGKIKNLFANTPYGEYLTNNAVKGTITAQIKACPPNAQRVFQIDFTTPLTVYQYGKDLYVKNGVDKYRRVFTDVPKEYHNNYVLRASDKALFAGVFERYKNGRIFFDTPDVAESFRPFLKLFAML